MQSEFARLVEAVISKAEKILAEYSLCNNCLGRLFAKYGVGLSNYERGLMIKTLLAIKLYENYVRGAVSRDYLKTLAKHSGEGIASMYAKLFNEDSTYAGCYVCGDRLGKELVVKVARDACEKLAQYGAKKFLVGVKVSREIMDKELELIAKYGLESSESIRREIRREVGKAIASLCGICPDFSSPEVIVVVNFRSDFGYETSVQSNPLFYVGYYWKLGRRISHVPWYTKMGARKYPASVQEMIEGVLKRVFNSEKVVIHAAGREDIDVRMMGSGRPLVIEVKSPRRRSISLDELRSIVKSELGSLNVPLEVEVLSTASRRVITLLKEQSGYKRKLYRMAIYSTEKIEPSDLSRLEEFFTAREIRQRTPLRILRRKKDRERIRKVYAVKTLQMSDRVFEALIYCDGGLYVKELVHCDGGRTEPCFARILGKNLLPLELDVVYVER